MSLGRDLHNWVSDIPYMLNFQEAEATAKAKAEAEKLSKRNASKGCSGSGGLNSSRRLASRY